ncbi:MAG: phosphoribosyl-ATP diphosphatase, partial [Clostridia bacterium]|nr:phosphoribosyl-ATP diphosphatase [Clostridia bacterium]
MNDTLSELYEVILGRKAEPQEGSYTCYLFEKGLDKILKKVGEEASEVIIAAKNGDNGETTGEIADLFYHIFVLMAEQGITPKQLGEILAQRS